MVYYTYYITVSFHNLKSQNLKSSVSNPKSKYVAYLSVLSQISDCQSLGRKNKHENLKTDRTRLFVYYLYYMYHYCIIIVLSLSVLSAFSLLSLLLRGPRESFVCLLVVSCFISLSLYIYIYIYIYCYVSFLSIFFLNIVSFLFQHRLPSPAPRGPRESYAQSPH